MKRHHLTFIIPIVFIALSAIVAFNIFLKRIDYDSGRNTAQFALKAHDISTLQEISGNDLPTILAILKDQVGISTIVLPEYTIKSYEELSKVTVLEGYQIINTLRVGQLYRTVLSRLRRKTSIKPQATYIVVDEVAVYNRIIGHLKLFLPRESVIEHSGQIIQVNISKDRLMSLPIGFDSDLVKSLVSFDFKIVPEFKSYEVYSLQKNQLTFNELTSNLNVKSVMFHKSFLFTEQSHIDEYVQLIKRNNFNLVMPEFSKYFYEDYKGLQHIANELSSQVKISHSRNFKNDDSLTFNQLFERYMKALKERSLNIMVFSVNTAQNQEGLYDQNILFMKKVIDAFKRSGGYLDQSKENSVKLSVAFWEKAMIGIGIFSMVYIFLFTVFRFHQPRQHVLCVGILLLLYGITLLASSIMVQVYGSMAAIVAPILSMILFFPTYSQIKPFKNSSIVLSFLSFLLKVFMVCSVSILFLIALYTDPVYLNNIVPFWGVKLALLTPVLFVAIYYFCGPLRINSFIHVVKRTLNYPITFNSLIGLCLCLIVIMIYLFRSGNYLDLAAFENMIRTYLQDIFVVRPRFKEFLVGYPALIFSFWLASKKVQQTYLWFINALGVIALTSFINSFCHFHTPVMISIYRSLVGLFLGIFVSLLFFILYQILKTINQRLQRVSKSL